MIRGSDAAGRDEGADDERGGNDERRGKDEHRDGDGGDDTSDRREDAFEPANPIAADSEPADSVSDRDGDSAEPSPRTDDRLSIPLETIAVLNWLGEIGVDGVESRLRGVSTDDLTVETQRVKIGYAGPETILDQFGVEDRAGARVPVQKPFSGTVLVLFPVESANRAASLMLRRAVEDAESVVSTEMGRDALTELCNVMANGFVDEWAELFDTPIDTGAPVAVQNPEMTLLHHIFSVSDVGLYLTSRLRLAADDIDVTVFVFPGEERFVTEISQFRPDVIDR
ncbi:chemotaxis protein CheC [Halorussus aquaticus]|uniref:Chemotaxis protein CheC n=1 Tax=Halorussus aquaticus TaxID=2953748 RepID=A0ABD5Q7V5_9EURY|nr:chemotaxis protein CheC [Halorussus aquaticus]